jgi:mannose-6-phosphate isomerase-like protein (cupin superfamily)
MGHDREAAREADAGRSGATRAGLRQRWVSAAQAGAVPVPTGQLAAPVLAHGSLLVEYYAPRGKDTQTPHTRDEVYVVIGGSGWFVNGPERHRFQAHDVLFVPAGVVHRFEDFTDDFAVWVMFYGPKGGETADPTRA